MRWVRSYFYSGWAFFIPYLLFYLLYHALRWPVNHSEHRDIPSLLHLYWVLHSLNIVGALLALSSWWQDKKHCREAAHVVKETAINVAPWLPLALLFFIPGAYLEWPSDPWEHLKRINEWRDLQLTEEHVSWFKSGYFLIYSLLKNAHGPAQQPWLDLYYTGICLLLCWQYHRLARATGLSEQASLIFVILQAVFFGNSIFSFYRYYGISSSIYAQLGAVALTREALEHLCCPAGTNSRHAMFVGKAILLGLLIGFNHIQGLGLVILGLGAVGGWQLVRQKPVMAIWLPVMLIGLSASTLSLQPPNPVLDQAYKAGWLTSWYGFNSLAWNSASGARAGQIFGLFGLVNLCAGLLLMRRNHIVGWLTVMPVVALYLPVFSIPLATLLTHRVMEDISAFHRFFFGIPTGLALVVACHQVWAQKSDIRTGEKRPSALAFRFSATTWAAILLILTAIPTTGPYYNRVWHFLSAVPNDLALGPPSADFLRATTTQRRSEFSALAGVSGLSFGLISQGAVPAKSSTHLFTSNRLYWNERRSPATDLEYIRGALLSNPTRIDYLLVIPRPTLFYTPRSFAGVASSHWAPQEAAFIGSGARELQALAGLIAMKPVFLPGTLSYFRYANRN